MSVSENDVRHIAALARLGLPEQRIPALVDELNRILGHMDVLQQVDLTAADAAAIEESEGMPLRADVVNAVPLVRRREDFAPAMRDGFFLVPRLDTHGAAASGNTSDDESQS